MFMMRGVTPVQQKVPWATTGYLPLGISQCLGKRPDDYYEPSLWVGIPNNTLISLASGSFCYVSLESQKYAVRTCIWYIAVQFDGTDKLLNIVLIIAIHM